MDTKRNMEMNYDRKQDTAADQDDMLASSYYIPANSDCSLANVHFGISDEDIGEVTLPVNRDGRAASGLPARTVSHE